MIYFEIDHEDFDLKPAKVGHIWIGSAKPQTFDEVSWIVEMLYKGGTTIQLPPLNETSELKHCWLTVLNVIKFRFIFPMEWRLSDWKSFCEEREHHVVL
jgi:hypothetical protein